MYDDDLNWFKLKSGLIFGDEKQELIAMVRS